LAVTRVAIGRTGADRDRLVDEIERGVEGATEGYRRRSRRLRDSGPVPLLELDYDRRAAGARASSRVLTRFLLFRRHTVVLSIAPSAAGSRAPTARRDRAPGWPGRTRRRRRAAAAGRRAARPGCAPPRAADRARRDRTEARRRRRAWTRARRSPRGRRRAAR